MNTPKPCDTCVHLYINGVFKDDPLYEAECILKNEFISCGIETIGILWGNINCSFYADWDKERKENKKCA